MRYLNKIQPRQLIIKSFLTGMMMLFLFPGFNLAQNANPSAKKQSDFITQDDKEFAKIKNLKVKTRLQYYIEQNKPDTAGANKKLIKKEKFNKNGMLTELTEYNSRGIMTSSFKFFYDSKSRPIKAEGEDDAGRSNIQTSRYDSRGYEIERTLLSQGRRLTETKTVLTYDKNGNIIELKNYVNNKLNDEQNISYLNNKRIKTVVKDGKGDTVMVVIPEFDLKGKLIREEKIDGPNKVVENYKYDDNGNLIEYTDHETRKIYSFNANNDVIEYMMFLLDGRRQIKLVFKYNSDTLQSEHLRYDNNEVVVFQTAYEYEFYK